MKNKNLKKFLLLYSITLLASIYYYNNYIETSENKNKKTYSNYSKGNVYIGSKDYLDNLEDISEYDILVEDERDGSNPSMKIRNSYLITDKNTRIEILNILKQYEKNHPSNWNRSIDTMNLEWEAHNSLYYLNYKRDHTTDVDLDNEDEEKYAKILK